MRGTRSGTGRHIPPGYVLRPGIIPKSHFLIGGYTSTDENLRGEQPKIAGGRAHSGKPSSAMLRGELASLASAVPRAAAARFRRAPAMILGPRRASLLAPSRNLFANE